MITEDFEDLKGMTISKVDVDACDSITFFTDQGTYKMYHEQDCCEDVTIEDICGDWSDILLTPITTAEEVTHEGEDDGGSITWTFYHIGTVKGVVTIRWYGSSNGYYSESVDFCQVDEVKS